MLVVHKPEVAKAASSGRQVANTLKPADARPTDERRARRAEVRSLCEEGTSHAAMQNFDYARSKFQSALSLDPGCVAALDGLDRVRMQTFSARARAAAHDAADAAAEVASSLGQTQLMTAVLELWKPKDSGDPSRKVANKFLKLARHEQPQHPPKSKPLLSGRSECCGCGSLAGCISARRLLRSEQRLWGVTNG